MKPDLSLSKLRSKSDKQITDFEKIKKALKVQTDVMRGILTIYSKTQIGKYKELIQLPTDYTLKAPPSQVLKISPSPLITLKKHLNSTQITENPTLTCTKSMKLIKKQEKTSQLRKTIISKLSSNCFNIENKAKPQKPFEIWKFNNKLSLEAKVFVIQGKYPDLRNSLIKRGWSENPNSTSIFFDLKYSRNARVPFGIQDWQLINHFPNNIQLTAKWNLSKNLSKSLFKNIENSSLQFFPRCFKLNDSGFQYFAEYFKVNFAISVLKEATLMPFSVHYEKLAAAVQIAKRWAVRLKMRAEDNEIEDFKVVPDNDWRILNVVDLRMIGFYYTKYCKDDDLHTTAKEILSELESIDPQFFINGHKNIWIVKPGHKSRGRDISLHTSLREIYEFINTREYCVVQKYIENPLLINNKKFDIRQWVLVYGTDPLQIWIYKSCYLRFSVNDYTTAQLSDVFTHLTNNSISKKSKEFNQSDIEGCMWNSEKFRLHLESEHGSDIWTQKISKEIRNIIIKSLLSIKTLGRKKSFELFGYDLMIDNQFKTWLIEINSSPAMDYSTVI